MNDPVNHPAHYNASKLEVIEAIEAWELNFHLGNVVKYIVRADHKGGVQDLEKAVWYLKREIAKRNHQQREEAQENA